MNNTGDCSATSIPNSTTPSNKPFLAKPADPPQIPANIQVSIRVRPPLDFEGNDTIDFEYTATKPPPPNTAREFDSLALHNPRLNRKVWFNYDHVFTPTDNQQSVYHSTTRTLLDAFMLGYNVTIFAYGQSGSGKTFATGLSKEATQMNFPTSGGSATAAALSQISACTDPIKMAALMNLDLRTAGILQNIGCDIFARINQQQQQQQQQQAQMTPQDEAAIECFTVLAPAEMGDMDSISNETPIQPLASPTSAAPTTSMSLSMTLVEIYMDDVVDLLEPNNGASKVSIRDRPDGQTELHGAAMKSVDNITALFQYVNFGIKNRTTTATKLNNVSSRSHCILTLYLKSTSYDPSTNHTTTMIRKLNVCDLAGSERAAKTNCQGDHLKEGIAINSSLSALSRVISSIVKKQQLLDNGQIKAAEALHIPYRESSITKLLRDSLQGRSLTLLMACLSPAMVNFEESIQTCHFATTVRGIKTNDAVVMKDKDSMKFEQLEKEIQFLRDECNQMRDKLGLSMVNYSDKNTQKQMLAAQMTNSTPMSSNPYGAATWYHDSKLDANPYGGLMLSHGDHTKLYSMIKQKDDDYNKLLGVLSKLSHSFPLDPLDSQDGEKEEAINALHQLCAILPETTTNIQQQESIDALSPSNQDDESPQPQNANNNNNNNNTNTFSDIFSLLPPPSTVEAGLLSPAMPSPSGSGPPLSPNYDTMSYNAAFGLKSPNNPNVHEPTFPGNKHGGAKKQAKVSHHSGIQGGVKPSHSQLMSPRRKSHRSSATHRPQLYKLHTMNKEKRTQLFKQQFSEQMESISKFQTNLQGLEQSLQQLAEELLNPNTTSSDAQATTNQAGQSNDTAPDFETGNNDMNECDLAPGPSSTTTTAFPTTRPVAPSNTSANPNLTELQSITTNISQALNDWEDHVRTVEEYHLYFFQLFEAAEDIRAQRAAKDITTEETAQLRQKEQKFLQLKEKLAVKQTQLNHTRQKVQQLASTQTNSEQNGKGSTSGNTGDTAQVPSYLLKNMQQLQSKLTALEQSKSAQFKQSQDKLKHIIEQLKSSQQEYKAVLSFNRQQSNQISSLQMNITKLHNRNKILSMMNDRLKTQLTTFRRDAKDVTSSRRPAISSHNPRSLHIAQARQQKVARQLQVEETLAKTMGLDKVPHYMLSAGRNINSSQASTTSIAAQRNTDSLQPTSTSALPTLSILPSTSAPSIPNSASTPTSSSGNNAGLPFKRPGTRATLSRPPPSQVDRFESLCRPTISSSKSSTGTLNTSMGPSTSTSVCTMGLMTPNAGNKRPLQTPTSSSTPTNRAPTTTIATTNSSAGTKDDVFSRLSSRGQGSSRASLRMTTATQPTTTGRPLVAPPNQPITPRLGSLPSSQVVVKGYGDSSSVVMLQTCLEDFDENGNPYNESDEVSTRSSNLLSSTKRRRSSGRSSASGDYDPQDTGQELVSLTSPSSHFGGSESHLGAIPPLQQHNGPFPSNDDGAKNLSNNMSDFSSDSHLNSLFDCVESLARDLGLASIQSPLKQPPTMTPLDTTMTMSPPHHGIMSALSPLNTSRSLRLNASMTQPRRGTGLVSSSMLLQQQNTQDETSFTSPFHNPQININTNTNTNTNANQHTTPFSPISHSAVNKSATMGSPHIPLQQPSTQDPTKYHQPPPFSHSNSLPSQLQSRNINNSSSTRENGL